MIQFFITVNENELIVRNKSGRNYLVLLFFSKNLFFKYNFILYSSLIGLLNLFSMQYKIRLNKHSFGINGMHRIIVFVLQDAE